MCRRLGARLDRAVARETNLANHSLNRDLVPNVRDSVRSRYGRSTTSSRSTSPTGRPRCSRSTSRAASGRPSGFRGVLDHAKPAVWLEYWPDGIRANGNDPAVLDILYDRVRHLRPQLVDEKTLPLTTRSSPTATSDPAFKSRASSTSRIVYLTHPAQTPTIPLPTPSGRSAVI